MYDFVPKHGWSVIYLEELGLTESETLEVPLAQRHLGITPVGNAMYTITVRYSEHGLIAMSLKAESIQLAQERALHFKSQAFQVEIKNAEDSLSHFTLNTGWHLRLQ